MVLYLSTFCSVEFLISKAPTGSLVKADDALFVSYIALRIEMLIVVNVPLDALDVLYC